METVVAVALVFSFDAVGFEDREKAFILTLLGGESDDGRGAACYSAAGAGFEAIACGGVLLGEVNMAIDAAGRDVCSFGVDDLSGG